MEDLLRMLESDEKIIWQGKPENFETLDKTHKNIFVRRLIMAAATSLILVSVYLWFMLSKGNEINWFFVIAVPVLSALSPVAIYTYARRLRKKTLYAASNKRLFVFSGDLRDCDYSMIKKACFKTDEDGHTSLLCGDGAINAPAGKWRVCSLFGLNDLEAVGGPCCDRFAFYALADKEELRKALAPYLKIEG